MLPENSNSRNQYGGHHQHQGSYFALRFYLNFFQMQCRPNNVLVLLEQRFDKPLNAESFDLGLNVDCILYY